MCLVLSGRLEKCILRDPSSPEIPIGRLAGLGPFGGIDGLAFILGEVAAGGTCGDMGAWDFSLYRNRAQCQVPHVHLLFLPVFRHAWGQQSSNP